MILATLRNPSLIPQGDPMTRMKSSASCRFGNGPSLIISPSPHCVTFLKSAKGGGMQLLG